MPSRFVQDHSNVMFDKLNSDEKAALYQETIGLLKVPGDNDLAGMFNNGAAVHLFYAQPSSPPENKRGAVTLEQPLITPATQRWGNDF